MPLFYFFWGGPGLVGAPLSATACSARQAGGGAGSTVLDSTSAVGCAGSAGDINGDSERCAVEINGAVGSSGNDDFCPLVGFGGFAIAGFAGAGQLCASPSILYPVVDVSPRWHRSTCLRGVRRSVEAARVGIGPPLLPRAARS